MSDDNVLTAFRGVDNAFVQKNVAAGVGSILEWYDFAVFGGLADVLAEALFPQAGASLLEALAVFGAAFFMRPLGALVVGAVADSYTRKFALELSIVMMAIPTVLIACIPPFSVWGYASTSLLLFLRLSQGFFVGGEIVTAFVFIFENTPKARDAPVFAALQFGFVNFGSASGLAVALLLRTILSHDQLLSFGWRIAFALGGPIALVGIVLRRGLTDDSAVSKRQDGTPITFESLLRPVRAAAAEHGLRMLLFGLVAATALTPFYISFIWLPLGFEELNIDRGFSISLAGIALLLILIAGFAGFTRAHEPTMIAKDSDDAFEKSRIRFDISKNARYMYRVGMIVLLVMPPIMFALLDSFRNELTAAATIVVLASGTALVTTALPGILVTSFPPENVTVAAGFAYNVTAAVFGGLAPIYAMLLIDISPILVGLLISGVSVISTTALYLLEWTIDPEAYRGAPADGSAKKIDAKAAAYGATSVA
ncbi:major facilitator superfamily domain-containing protein [Pelagophyceae sp. CCMP2097]|nr:major facilitator superfamily domain-containing protein [Pelagophyceae sp. CCMP2097]